MDDNSYKESRNLVVGCVAAIAVVIGTFGGCVAYDEHLDARVKETRYATIKAIVTAGHSPLDAACALDFQTTTTSSPQCIQRAAK